METMILLFWELWLSAVSELAVCCCGSLSGGPLLLLAIRPFHFMSLASPSPRKASLTPTFTYLQSCDAMCWSSRDICQLPFQQPHIWRDLFPFSCSHFITMLYFHEFLTIHINQFCSEKKICVNSKTYRPEWWRSGQISLASSVRCKQSCTGSLLSGLDLNRELSALTTLQR